MSQRNLLILLLATVFSYACYVRGEKNPYARYVAGGFAAIEQDSLQSVPERELFAGAMEGMVGVLRRYGDEHSQFLAEDEADPLRTEIRQQFGGIGVRIAFQGEPPRLVIVGPPDPGTPADRAHLLPGDQIVAIDSQPIDDLTMGDVLRRMRGQPGTKVRLSIQQEGDAPPRTVELTREVINLQSILGDRRREEGGWAFRLAADPRVAHIRIASFGDRTAADLASVLENVLAAGAEAAALDLRDNAGGSLDAAVAVCEMLLPAGKTIVETRGRGGALRKRYQSERDGPFLELPLAVIVNQNSASAAEILAACLQDHGRAVIVGQRTYGKGTVQQLVPLGAGDSLLKLTWASFWRPNGAKIHRAAGGAEDETWGVVPNPEYERVLTRDEYAAYRKYRTSRDMDLGSRVDKKPGSGEASAAQPFVDQQLQTAVEYLQAVLDQAAEP